MGDIGESQEHPLIQSLKDAVNWTDAELLFRLETSICHEFAVWINGVHAGGDPNKVRMIQLYNNVPLMEYMRRFRFKKLTTDPTNFEPLYRYNLEPLYRIVDRLGRDYYIQFAPTPAETIIHFVNKPSAEISPILKNMLSSVQSSRMLTNE